MSDRFESRAADWDFNPRIIQMFRAFRDKFRTEISLSKSMNLLDVGGGTGLIAFDLADAVNSVTIVDSSPAMVKTARERLIQEKITNVNILENDILHADLEKQSYDGVYAHMLLHHVENINEAFDRFSELLVSGGVMVIGDLISEDGLFHGDDAVPHNGFNPVELSAKLMMRGFGKIRTLPLESVDRPETGRVYDRFFLIAERS